MPRKLPPHVEAWRDRHGKLRAYFRRGKGGRVPLPPIGTRSLSKPTLRRLYAPHPKGTKVSTRCAGDYHGIDIGWLDRNPALGIKKPRLGEVRSWSDSEIAAFETRWPVGTRERLAFGLMLFTGQRRTDVFRMTWADINGDEIRVIRQSGGSSPG